MKTERDTRRLEVVVEPEPIPRLHDDSLPGWQRRRHFREQLIQAAELRKQGLHHEAMSILRPLATHEVPTIPSFFHIAALCEIGEITIVRDDLAALRRVLDVLNRWGRRSHIYLGKKQWAQGAFQELLAVACILSGKENCARSQLQQPEIRSADCLRSLAAADESLLYLDLNDPQVWGNFIQSRDELTWERLYLMASVSPADTSPP